MPIRRFEAVTVIMMGLAGCNPDQPPAPAPAPAPAAAPAPDPAPAKSAEAADERPFTSSLGMTMIRIAPGEFVMGSEAAVEEKPPHRVRIAKPFFIAAHLLTQAQFRKVLENNPSRFNDGDERKF